MDDRLDFVLFKDLLQQRAIPEIAIVEQRTFSCNLFQAIQNIGLGIDEIIDDDDISARLQQLDAGVRPQIARPSCN